MPAPYFHVVFTLPHELNQIVLGHSRLLLRSGDPGSGACSSKRPSRRLNDYVPVEWDSDIQRWVIPFTNFYHNDTEWPEGWETTVEVQNSSGTFQTFTLFNQSYPYWGGPHGHPGSPPAECMYENFTPCGLCDKVHHFRTICRNFNVPSGTMLVQDAFRFHIADDQARSARDGGGSLQIWSGNPTGISVQARIYPNSSGTSCALCNP